MGCNILLDLE